MKPALATRSTALLGATGEHFVMYQLLRRGFTAALAPAGVPKADILVTNALGNRLCAIQVKTRMHPIGGGWRMSAKNEADEDLLFYVCVDLAVEHQPVCFVIPSAVVARTLVLSHQYWLSTPRRDGRPHKDCPVRVLLPDYDRIGQQVIGRPSGWLEPYREAWHLIAEQAAGKPEGRP